MGGEIKVDVKALISQIERDLYKNDPQKADGLINTNEELSKFNSVLHNLTDPDNPGQRLSEDDIAAIMGAEIRRAQDAQNAAAPPVTPLEDEPTVCERPSVDRLGRTDCYWKDLADMYKDTFDTFFAEGGTVFGSRDFTERRIIKLIQCIRDFNYSAERIDELLIMSEAKVLTRDNCPEWFDYDAYVKQLKGFPSQETYIPKYILYPQDKPIDKLTDEEKADLCKRGEPNVTRTRVNQRPVAYIHPAKPTEPTDRIAE